jgi:amino acid adenylation domain-containing protein
MTVSELLKRLRASDIRVWADGNRLRVSAPRGALDADLQAAITRLKPELLAWLTQEAAMPETAPLVRVTRDRALPLSSGQSRLWFLNTMNPEAIAYHMVVNALVHHVDIDALRRAVAAVVSRHEILRTTIEVVDGAPCQRIAPPGPVAIEHDDLRSVPEAERAAEFKRRARARAFAPFDLTRGPLIRFLLYQLDDDTSELVIAQHHLISDGWSISLLLRELFASYETLKAGGDVAVSEPALQYADYAVWQQALMASTAIERQIEYWRNELSTIVPLDLPTDRPRPAVQTFRGAAQSFQLSPETTAAIKSISRDLGATVHMTLLAGFGAFLKLWSGQTDLAVGSANGNRSRVELEQMLGFFVDTQVLRLDYSGDPTFREMVRRVAAKSLDAHANSDVPFSRLVEVLRPARDLSRSPFCDVLFILQNTPIETEIRGGAAAATPSSTPVAQRAADPTLWPTRSISAGGAAHSVLETGTAKLDLTLYVEEAASGYRGTFEYNTDLFDDETITRALDRFEAILELCVRRPDRRLSELPKMTPVERELLSTWNQTGQPVTGSAWHEMVGAQAEATPSAVAVRCGAAELTYAALTAEAVRIAAGLRALGIRKGDIVGLFVERSADMIAAMIGIARCGAAYLPLDPAFPAERLEYMVKDAGAAVLVTDPGLRAVSERFGVRTLVLGSREQLPSGIAEAVGPDALAYVIYTSGSTGRPKGVEVPHGALANFLESMRREPGLRHTDTLLAVTTLSFDIAALELMLPLVSGGTVVIASRAEAIDPVALQAALVSSRATVMQATPITWRMLLDSGWTPAPGFRALCGGEAMPRELAQQLLRRGVELWNLYGPTETTVWSTVEKITDASARVTIGRPIANTQIRILDTDGCDVAPGTIGEICIGGAGLARGYHNRPELTAERFVPDGAGPARLYRTGDRGRWRSDGRLECFGRIDHQVKVRGFRIELGEIETVIAGDAAVAQAVVHVWGEGTAARLVAYLVPQPGASVDIALVRERVADALPAYMHPTAYSVLDRLPLTANGKIDRKALPAPDGSGTEREFIAPRDAMESLIASIWRDVLGIEQIGARESFFDLGGHSLLVVQVQSRLTAALGRSIPVVELFQYPTVEALARHLGGAPAIAAERRRSAEQRHAGRAGRTDDAVAIIAMAGRFPGASTIEAFWKNLRQGVESVRRFTAEELIEAGIPAQLARDPNYIPVRGVLDDADRFDARYFGYTPRDAELIDPQQRVFLEVAAEALDRAGYDPYSYRGAIGVFAGASLNSYIANLLADPGVASSLTGVQLLLAGDKDHLPTRVSYKLDLRGPSINVQTACSTSLVAVHQACRSLLDLDCDIALAGGVSIGVPLKGGYRYVEGGIQSPDGHCRAFDAQAQGTVPGNGCGIVVLKRLSDAVRDGDVIHAVIRGSGINNDGSDKVSYTAPSVRGQADALALAYAAAGVDPASVGYVEAHGTATPLGDPIEIQALTTMMREHTRERGFCAIGSLKTNVGHMDAAAGVGGLIKAALAVEHAEIPPSLHYAAPNREIDFDNSPFRVADALRPWPAAVTPRRAGVSSFGIGGTNAHVVIEQAPRREPSGPSRAWQVLPLSARSATALTRMAQNLADHLEQNGDIALPDVAHTLSVGRPAFEHRRAIVCDTTARAIAALRATDAASARQLSQQRPKVVFMFPGQGAQYAGMGRELYATEATYRAAIDECAALVAAQGVEDIKTVLLARTPAELAAANLRLGSTLVTQLALFVTEYALARTLDEWGIVPDALIGHSIGEYVAACVSGALSLTDAIALVVTRGKLMERAPAGGMLAVQADEQALSRWIDDESLWLAAVNGPGQCVVAGRADGIERLRRELSGTGIDSLPLRTAGAFHSGLMDDVVGPLSEAVRSRPMVSPRIPFISNVTGRPIGDDQIADPSYWGRHLRHTVRFSAGVTHLLGAGATIFVEVGPGFTLGGLVRRHTAGHPGAVVIACMRQVMEAEAVGLERMATAVARLWVEGVNIDWPEFRRGERRLRLELPSYPFERQRYWIDAPAAGASPRVRVPVRTNDIEQWFSAPVWKRLTTRAAADSTAPDSPEHWLVFGDDSSLTAGVTSQLRARGHDVAVAVRGAAFKRTAADRFELDPAQARDYQQLLATLKNDGRFPDRVIHAWLMPAADNNSTEALVQQAFYGPLFLAQALGDLGTGRPLRITVLASEIFDVMGGESLVPAKATVLGPVRVVPAEYSGVTCGLIDMDANEWHAPDAATLDQLIRMISAKREGVVALRRGFEWCPALERVSLPATTETVFRHGGVYLLTGGYGGIGRSLGRVLAERFNARLILVGRNGVPPRDEWDRLLSSGAPPDVVERIATVQSLEAAGGVVLPLTADVTSEHDLRTIVAAARETWGPINGVIHAAGIAGGGVIQLKTMELANRVLAPKVAGTEALMRALEGTPVDFVALCSSITSLEGGPGQVDYCAANAFLDAYATNYARQSGANVVAINWNAWRDVGMAVEAAMPEEIRRRRANQLRDAIAPSEGAQAFLRLMSAGCGAQIQVSPYVIEAAGAASVPGERPEDASEQPAMPAGHDRPELATAFAAPQNEIEERVAAIWQELFGIGRIGVNDDFFALGGHSLLATQITSRVKAEFGLPVSLHDFFAAPTITGLSDLLLGQLLEQEAIADGQEAPLDDFAKR